jgi:hypothetical protein
MEHLSRQDAGYIQKIASGRMKLFGWSGWFCLLAPAALAVVAWVGLLTWIHHKLPEGTRLVICLWDGKRYQPSEDLFEHLASLGLLLLLFVSIYLFIATYCLRLDHNRLVRISQFVCSRIGAQPTAPPLNGGPATPVGNLGGSEGPPSAS